MASVITFVASIGVGVSTFVALQPMLDWKPGMALPVFKNHDPSPF
jgi:hypothetical protein